MGSRPSEGMAAANKGFCLLSLMHHRKNLGSKLSPAIQRLTPGGVRFAPAARIVAEKRAEARMKGYVGETCPDCGNLIMRRNETCLECDTCGARRGARSGQVKDDRKPRR